ncbi:type IV toxin-antitoxin system AbiEi family antitoxin domain-containing protein [Arthrobacter alpinus]|uniref:type IV toxin-antitoxin system AbiEi family antitoxin domain-containing protein n=1 Tax=Arthrobacter alpinus TaxID=656366 RepID=UPI0016447AEC|nr:type IV toxin-antitoxin system AbiEi family antitoxin domain-containing protein [Arthrobacter alpinus]
MDFPQFRDLLERKWPSTAVLGVATTAMLASAGITDRTLTAGLRCGLLKRLHRGSYVSVTVWNAAKPWVREDMVLIGHVLASHSHGVYSHSSAARLHGLRTWGCGDAVHLTQEFAFGNSGGAHRVRGHQQLLAPSLVTSGKVGGIRVPVTTIAQTVLDCARLFAMQEAVIIGDHALRKGLQIAQLQALLVASPVVRGSAKARLLLAVLDGRSESAGESRTRVLVGRMDMPQPELQVEMATRYGNYRLDFAWKQYKLALEFDGWGKYFDFEPTDEAIARERQREKALMELGWQFIRIDWAALSDPAGLESRIRASLVRAGARLPVRRSTLFA